MNEAIILIACINGGNLFESAEEMPLCPSFDEQRMFI
jgi:hypothetical protein